MRKASRMQLQAIMHGEGPARVLAGPGSGKTFTIIQRINYLITHYHISPNQILCITFTKAAAMEMKQRFYHDFKQNVTEEDSNVCFATIHSLCYQILKESGEFSHHSLINESVKYEIIKNLLAKEGIEKEVDFSMIADILAEISKRKNLSDSKEPVCLSKEQFEIIYTSYNEMLKERNLIDYDDMIAEAYILLKRKPEICKRWQEKFCHILVDEFQDVNEIQYKMIKLLASPQNNLFMVGDDDQSIYGFRGAVPGIMKQFAQDYTDMKQLYLFENYRSGKEIVMLATQMISENHDRLPKKPIPIKGDGMIKVFFQEDRKSEEQLMLKHIKELTYEEQTKSAVILRTNREVYQYKTLLKKAGIPIKDKQKSDSELLHHFIMEDVCAFLRFIKEGRKREDFLRFMNKPERYLSRQPLSDTIVTEKVFLRYYEKNESICKEIHMFFSQIEKASQMSATLAIRFFRQVMGYDQYLMERAKTQIEQVLWSEYIIKIQKMFGKMKEGEKIDSFLRRTEDEWSQSDIDENNKMEGISVQTMHSVKGLEFLYVFLPDLNEGVIPGRTCKSKESLEEERRLLYVAITRAIDALYLYYTKERNRKPTRFLKNYLEKRW